MNEEHKIRKEWEKPLISRLSVKGLTLHGAEYAPNESVGSDRYSPKFKDDGYNGHKS